MMIHATFVRIFALAFKIFPSKVVSRVIRRHDAEDITMRWNHQQQQRAFSFKRPFYGRIILKMTPDLHRSEIGAIKMSRVRIENKQASAKKLHKKRGARVLEFPRSTVWKMHLIDEWKILGDLTLCKPLFFFESTKSHCLKITQNVSFEFWHFSSIFVLLKWTVW